ncbi:ABC transporter ATP-binding protein, partial [Streptosporangium sandarakinum]
PQRVRFRPSHPFDDAILRALPEVTEVRHENGRVEVSGTGDLLPPVVSALTAAGVIPADLRVEQATLDDAFLALTGKKISA